MRYRREVEWYESVLFNMRGAICKLPGGDNGCFVGCLFPAWSSNEHDFLGTIWQDSTKRSKYLLFLEERKEIGRLLGE